MNILMVLIIFLYFAIVISALVFPISLLKKGDYKSCIKASVAFIILGVCNSFSFFLACYQTQTLVAAKPIIYLYPEQTQEISVKLVNNEIVTTSYPKYDKEWKVIANPDGSLKDIDSNRNLYALYWEGNINSNVNDKEGFIVKREDSIQFLEEKLAILGLNEREAEEFIVYWLPILEKSRYNLIRFETTEEINNNMPLEINPKPDTLIRVMMEFMPLDEKINVKEQKLEKVERKGYTAVEWGGSNLKNNNKIR